MHLADYPALPPPLNAQARAELAPASAPTIAFGSPHNNDLLEQARVEYKLRKLYHARRLVTDSELMLARQRWTALLNEYSVNVYPPTPQSTLDLIHRLCRQLQEEHADVPAAAALLDAVAALRSSLDEVGRALVARREEQEARAAQRAEQEEVASHTPRAEPPGKKEKRRRG